MKMKKRKKQKKQMNQKKLKKKTTNGWKKEWQQQQTTANKELKEKKTNNTYGIPKNVIKYLKNKSDMLEKSFFFYSYFSFFFPCSFLSLF